MLYGVKDSDGIIYAAYRSPDDPGLETVPLVENYTREESDYTSTSGKNYIDAYRLAYLFDQMCIRTGMKKKELAKMCGKSDVIFSYYCNGKTPVPQLVWEKVEQFDRKERK